MKQVQITYAKRFEGVTGSAIREILKLLNTPGMISFAGGNPAESALEDQVIANLSMDVLKQYGKKLLQYATTEGFMPYRVQTAAFLREDVGMDVTEDHVLPTTGSTQAIDLLLKALIDEGDTVLVEGPSFLGSLQAMKLYGANLAAVPMDDEGIIPGALEEAARKYRPKLLYTVPNFQNPTGVTMSLARRKAVVALAEQYDFLIAEDDPYRGLRYSGEAMPTMFSFDESMRVVYLTSFSKLISPGMRIGAVITKHTDLLRKLTIGKQSTDVHTPSLTQAIAAEYLSRGLLKDHMISICAQYKKQLDTMMSGFAGFPEGTTYTRPDGGLFVWVELPEHMDAVALLQKAVERGLAYVPGTYFYADGGHMNTLRLNFSNSEVLQIEQGMDRLRSLVHGA